MTAILYPINIFIFKLLQESEIVEILWKQDVDLGYSLEPIKLPTVAESLFIKNANDSDDETEKLKALEEIKNEKVKNS